MRQTTACHGGTSLHTGDGLSLTNTPTLPRQQLLLGLRMLQSEPVNEASQTQARCSWCGGERVVFARSSPRTPLLAARAGTRRVARVFSAPCRRRETGRHRIVRRFCACVRVCVRASVREFLRVCARRDVRVLGHAAARTCRVCLCACASVCSRVHVHAPVTDGGGLCVGQSRSRVVLVVRGRLCAPSVHVCVCRRLLRSSAR